MDKKTAEALRNSLIAKIELWASENGLEYMPEKVSVEFGENLFRLKSGLKFVQKGHSDEEAKKEFLKGAFTINSKNWDKGTIGIEDYKHSFTHKGLVFTLVGINTKAPKYPMIYEVSDGTRHKSGIEFYLMNKNN